MTIPVCCLKLQNLKNEKRQKNDQVLSLADKERLSKLVADIENLHIKGVGLKWSIGF